jgi:predicted nucleic acid-binding Zn ribbon protein
MRKTLALVNRCATIRLPMQRASRVLGSALRRLRRPEAGIAWLSATWPQVVGKTLASHTRPVRCESGHLEITADGKEWARQLQSMEREFCAQINCAWGGDLVRDLTLVEPHREPGAAEPSGRSHQSRALDNQHTPFVRRRHS